MESGQTLINFEQTELRLGLPGGGGGSEDGGKSSSATKRVFMETVDLKLNLSSSMASLKELEPTKLEHKSSSDFSKPPSKTQVVGWPPVRSSRKNLGAQKNGGDNDGGGSGGSGGASFVKVSMDGAPYLRKVGLKLYATYKDLSHALAKMFTSFTAGYVPTYEDKDGDWMLVGDVPWEMFIASCKRLRIMKESEAIGLAPRTMEKRKNRS